MPAEFNFVVPLSAVSIKAGYRRMQDLTPTVRGLPMSLMAKIIENPAHCTLQIKAQFFVSSDRS